MMTTILIKKLSVSYDAKLRITHVSYSTTLPTSIEPLQALNLITKHITNPFFEHPIPYGNGTKIVGKLTGITADLGQQRYCFSIDGEPKCTDSELLVEIDIPL